MNDRIVKYLLYIVFFLSYSGQKFFLLILNSMGQLALSRQITIPIRILVFLSLITLFLKKNKDLTNNILKSIILFCFLFFFRLTFDINENNLKGYYLTGEEVLEYFILSVFIPLITLTPLKLDTKDYSNIFHAILISTFIFSLSSLISFRNFIGTVSRLTSETSDEAVLSPLILSYSGALGIGISTVYLLENKSNKFTNLILIGTLVFSLAPLYLGASRGSILALCVPLFFQLLMKRSKNRVLLTIFSAVGIGIIYVGSIYLGSGLFTRFDKGNQYSEGLEQDARTLRWKQGINQILDQPIFGNGLVIKGFDNYPHNIILETFSSLGFFGGFLFCLILIKAFSTSLKIIKIYPKYSWASVLFIQSLMQSMFSGSIVTATWLACSMGLVFTFDRHLKYNDLA